MLGIFKEITKYHQINYFFVYEVVYNNQFYYTTLVNNHCLIRQGRGILQRKSGEASVKKISQATSAR